MHYSIAALFIAISFAALGGCGQTGPLYMPPKAAPQTQPVEQPDSAEQQSKKP